MKKTIWITISDGEVSKTILQSDVFALLKERAKVVFLVNPKKVAYYRDRVGSSDVLIEAMPSPRSPFWEEIWADLFLYSLHTESLRVKIAHSYHSGGSLIGMLAKRLLWQLGRFRIYRSVCRYLYAHMHERTFDSLFEAHTPNLVFAANLTSPDDARLLKAARTRKIPTVGMPKGWDNLTLKTFLPIFPDALLVQTELMKTDAERLDYPSESITVVGFPKFDVYANPVRALSREAFMRQLGLDSSRPLMLYAGAGDQLAPHDEEILADLVQAIDTGVVPNKPQIVVRPHPKYIYRDEVIPKRDFWVLDRPGARTAGSSDFEFDEKDVLHLMNSLMHADVVIHTASTLGIEAAIFDKPSITLAYDGHAKLHESVSTARYYFYDHMRRALATGGMRVAHSFEELISTLNQYLATQSLDSAERAKMVRENAYMIDGQAGTRVAETLVSMMK